MDLSHGVTTSVRASSTAMLATWLSGVSGTVEVHLQSFDQAWVRAAGAQFLYVGRKVWIHFCMRCAASVLDFIQHLRSLQLRSVIRDQCAQIFALHDAPASRPRYAG